MAETARPASAPVGPPAAAAIAAAASTLRTARRVWITTHVKSDGDGIGCELALLRALASLGVEARAINDTLVPRTLRFLLARPDEVLVYDPSRDDAFLRAADTVVVVDVGLAYRLGRLEARFGESAGVKICLDHHLDMDPAFHHVLCDPDLNATGEILYPLLRALGAPLTREVASPLFVSISVDSGNFCYERCTPETFRIASELVAAGAEPYPLHVALNWSRALSEVKLEGEVIRMLRVDPGGAVACSTVSAEMLARYAMDPMEMPNIVNIPLSLEGVEIALLFVELEPGRVKVSARGKGRVKVCELARAFGGGGHPLAAGFSVQGTLEEARTAVLAVCRRLLDAAPPPRKQSW